MSANDNNSRNVPDVFSLLNQVIRTESLSSLDFDVEQTLLNELQYQSNRPLRIAVVGQFSTGKSTFINSMLGQSLLPARYVPTTRQVMCIRHCTGTPEVALASTTGAAASGSASGKADTAATSDSSAAPARYPLSKEAVLDLAQSGEQLDLSVHIPPPWSDFEIYDTPGVNDATTLPENVIFDLMDKVDVGVFMMSAQQALTSSEVAFLGELVRQKDLGKFFFNVNFSDTQTEGEAESLRSYLLETLGQLRNWPVRELRDRVYLCSAKKTLDEFESSHDPCEQNTAVNEHALLLKAVHIYASSRRQELLDEAFASVSGIVARSLATKLGAAIDAVDQNDLELGNALKEINASITEFRVQIREEELALRGCIKARKAVLLSDIREAFSEVHGIAQEWIINDSLEDLTSESVGKRLSVLVEERLTLLLSKFHSDLDDAFLDLDERVLPLASRTSRKIGDIRQGLDVAPWVAGASIATAGYLVIGAALPWVLGAGGALALTAGLASFIPGVGGIVGALTGAGLATAASSLPAVIEGAVSGTSSGYRWLRDLTRDWQAKQSKDAYSVQVKAMIAKIERDVLRRLDEGIDPEKIVEGALSAKFPEALEMEERKNIASRLDRVRLREDRQQLELLRRQLIESTLPVSARHD